MGGIFGIYKPKPINAQAARGMTSGWSRYEKKKKGSKINSLVSTNKTTNPGPLRPGQPVRGNVVSDDGETILLVFWTNRYGTIRRNELRAEGKYVPDKLYRKRERIQAIFRNQDANGYRFEFNANKSTIQKKTEAATISPWISFTSEKCEDSPLPNTERICATLAKMETDFDALIQL